MPLRNRPSQSRVKTTIRAGGRAGVIRALKAVQKRHEDIVDGWSEASDKPEFSVEVKEQFRLVIGQVLMSGEKAESAGITVWQLLEHGTKIRFMKLSPDWASKTSPKQLSSGPGAGHKVGLDFDDPEGGITKREWGKTVAEAQQAQTDREVKSGWRNGFRSGIG